MTSNSQLRSCPDEDLILECVKRPVNERAWREFWRRFYPLVFRKVITLLRTWNPKLSHSAVDDIVQLVFLKIFTHLQEYDSTKSPFAAYLGMLTTRTLIDQLRRAKTGKTISFGDAGANASADRIQEAALEVDDLWRVVSLILRELEPTKRRIIEDFVTGEKSEIICSRYSIKRSHLYTIVYRFRRSVREALEKS